MSKLRKKLKDDAAIELESIVSDASAALDGLHPALNCDDVARLIFGNRTATLSGKIINKMADHAEAELLDKYNTQQDLPIDDKGDSL